MEKLTSDKPNITQEFELRYPGIRFEAANHPSEFLGKEDSWNKIIKRFFDGDSRVHIWNKEVGIRLNKYQPEIIAIDSAVPSPIPLPLEYAVMDWLMLPDRPTVFNTSGEVFVVKGDIVSYTDQAALAANIPANQQKTIIEILNGLTKQSLLNAATSSSAEGALPLVAYGVGSKVIEIIRKKRCGRRRLLKTAILGAVLASMPLAQSGAGILSASSTDQNSQNAWQSIASFIKPRLLPRTWTDGRTALMIAKIQDTIEYLKLPPSVKGSAIMGYGHIFEAETLLKDPAKRTKAIREFSQQLLSTYTKALDQHPQIPKDQAIANLIRYIARVDVIKATDQGDPDHNPNLPKTIDRNIQLIASFQSPQVEAALRNLKV